MRSSTHFHQVWSRHGSICSPWASFHALLKSAKLLCMLKAATWLRVLFQQSLEELLLKLIPKNWLNCLFSFALVTLCTLLFFFFTKCKMSDTTWQVQCYLNLSCPFEGTINYVLWYSLCHASYKRAAPLAPKFHQQLLYLCCVLSQLPQLQWLGTYCEMEWPKETVNWESLL